VKGGEARKRSDIDLNVFGFIALTANILAPSASATVSIRISAGFDLLKSQALKILARYPSITYKILAEYPPPDLHFEIPGFETINVGFGTDIPFLSGHEDPTIKKVLYGPGSIFVAHTADEHVLLSELETCKQGYKAIVSYFLSA
jgi:acetylornithine deacetylase